MIRRFSQPLSRAVTAVLVPVFLLAHSAPVFAAKPEPTATPQLKPSGEIPAVREARLLTVAGKNDEATKMLRNAVEHEKDKSQHALLRLAYGVHLYQLGQAPAAEVELTGALSEGLHIPEYAYYYRGRANREAGKLVEAKNDFQKSLEGQLPLEAQFDSRVNLAGISVDEKAWASAATQYGYLYKQKMFRNDQRYSEVIFQLMRASRHTHQSLKACKLAREIFAKYPTYTGIRDWGAKLEANTIDGEKVGCSAATKDLKMRARRLELGGESERAAKELGSVQKKAADEEGAFAVASLLASNLIGDGRIDEAMKVLLGHYEAEKNHPPYLILLGKALTRSGDYTGAAAAYHRAFEVAPHASTAAGALFQSAFTSYQMQDYDGASREFTQLTKSYAKSTFSRDGRWYVAWMRYLRGDNQGALESFSKLRTQPKLTRRRHGRRVIVADALSSDRLDYWSAMCLLKLGRTAEAVERLQKIARDPAIGYYSVLAYYRLQKTPGAALPTGLETRLGLKKQNATPGASGLPTEEELKSATEALQAAADDDAARVAGEAAAAAPAEEVAENANAETPAETSGEASAVAGDGAAGPGDAGATVKGEFKGAGLAVRFQRARDLAVIGLEEAARRELGEIERHIRQPQDRKLLMQEYALVRQFYRSSTIGDLGFGPERLRDGLRADGRTYWEYAYPRAWDASVLEASQSSAVPEELIWGIMRAESHYRSTAQSGVGALGLMQLMPLTGRKVADLSGLKSFQTIALLEPEINIKLGSKYLKRLLDKFSGAVPLVAASYNAGPHRVHAWVKNFGNLDMDEFIEHIPFLETRNYVKKVVRNYQIYNLLYARGAHSAKWVVEPVGVRLDDPIPTREVW